MKKILSLILALVMCFTAVSASAATIPDFLSEIPLNYTMKAEMSMEFTGVDKLVELLKKYEVYDKINTYVDIEDILSSLSKCKYDAYFDVNDDFSNINFGMIQKTDSSVVVNKNLNFSISAAQEMWLQLDLTKESLKLIYTQPIYNKYIVIDINELVDETERQQIFMILKTVLNKHYITTMAKAYAEIFVGNSTVSDYRNKYTISVNNEQFKKMYKELLQYICNIAESVTGQKFEDMDEVYNMIDSVNFLGKEGIKTEYTVMGGKVSSCDSYIDFSISFSEELCEQIGIDKDFSFSFKVREIAECTNYGKTKVSFPVLNKENSISYKELFPEPEYEVNDFDYYEPSYPNFFVSGIETDLPCVNEKYYYPLRYVMGNAFEDSVEILYENGVVTLKSEWFKDFKEVKLAPGKDIAYIDGKEYKITPPVVKDGVTYVDEAFFSEIFGWELGSLSYDLLNSVYRFTFYTSVY